MENMIFSSLIVVQLNRYREYPGSFCRKYGKISLPFHPLSILCPGWAKTQVFAIFHGNRKERFSFVCCEELYFIFAENEGDNRRCTGHSNLLRIWRMHPGPLRRMN